MSLFNPAVTAELARHAQAFRDAQPFRHLVIDQFLEPAFARRLLDEFPRFDARFALNEMGEVGGKAVREQVRELPAPYLELDAFIRSREFLDFASAATGIPDLLYDPQYVGGGTHENINGQSLDPHVDFNYHPGTKWHRRLNLIVYLNPDWDEAWGGCLELHSDPWQPATNRTHRVAPLLNRCVIFETTEVSWHGFQAIRLPAGRSDLSRKSFAIYLYTRERPADETAAPHATIYVPEGLPDGVGAGATLDAAQWSTIEARFQHARNQLRFLYEREKHFNRQIQVLERALDESRAALRLPLQGFATQGAAPEGYWPDAWVARELAFTVTPTRAAKSLTLEAWAPPALVQDQRVEVTVDGRTSQHVLRPGRVDTIRVALSGAAGRALAVSVRAAQTWSPASNGSGDDRALAYRLTSASIE